MFLVLKIILPVVPPFFILISKVQGSGIYKQGVSWTADDNIKNARDATNRLHLHGVDVMSWWCNYGGGGVAGIAFVGSLCSSFNTNLNERQWSSASSGFVSTQFYDFM